MNFTNYDFELGIILGMSIVLLLHWVNNKK